MGFELSSNHSKIQNRGAFWATKIGVDALLANEWASAALIFAVTRAVALLGAYYGASRVLLDQPTRQKGWFAEMALMWDSAWYVGVSQHGYSYDPSQPGGSSIAFAPLYPMLIRVLSALLQAVTFGWDWGNGAFGSYIAAGLIISNISFFVALVMLMRLLSPRLSRPGAVIVAFALASLPEAFFFSAIYTEGLFLLLAVSSLLVARGGWRLKWLCAGALGLLASLTRFTGALLVVVLAVEYLSQKGWNGRKIRGDALWLALVPAGTVIYAGYLWWRFGSPFVLNTTMFKGWNHQTSFFPATYWNSLAQLWQSATGAVAPANDPVLYYGAGDRLYIMLDMAMPVLLLVGALVAWKKLLASEWVWLLLGIIYPLSENITFSLARYLLPLWPGLIWLGTIERSKRWLLVAWFLISLGLLARCASIYARARWIG